jgi:hypothetical protein
MGPVPDMVLRPLWEICMLGRTEKSLNSHLKNTPHLRACNGVSLNEHDHRVETSSPRRIGARPAAGAASLSNGPSFTDHESRALRDARSHLHPAAGVRER